MFVRVATFALSDQMIGGALRNEATMANLQQQEASGLKSPFLAEYGADTQQIINLQVSVTRSQSFIDASTRADNKVQVMYSAVGNMTDLVTNLRQQLSAATLGNGTAISSAISAAQQALQQMASLMNSEYNGEFVFGGAQTSTPPADLTTFANGAGSLTTPDTSYYQGDGEIASVRVAADQAISYGVTANNPAFEQVMRVLKFVANSTTLNSTDIASALDLASRALDATTTVQAKLSTAAAQMESAKSLQGEFQAFAETLGSELTGVDVAAITAQLATYQSQLTASFSAISKIQGLSLANFLR
jgi:flagellar hook-associated protein 3 FlgL